MHSTKTSFYIGCDKSFDGHHFCVNFNSIKGFRRNLQHHQMVIQTKTVHFKPFNSKSLLRRQTFVESVIYGAHLFLRVYKP